MDACKCNSVRLLLLFGTMRFGDAEHLVRREKLWISPISWSEECESETRVSVFVNSGSLRDKRRTCA